MSSPRPVVVRVRSPALVIVLLMFVVVSVMLAPPRLTVPQDVSVLFLSCSVLMLISSPAVIAIVPVEVVAGIVGSASIAA